MGEFEKINGEVQESYSGIMTESGAEMPMERVLSHEDAVSITMQLYLV